jgi:cellulose synthase/poly-beta-1,6-N-acetylglucosamine synthase-like glycosyltransferase
MEKTIINILQANGIRVVVIIPTYNNAGTLRDILNRVLYNGLPVIVVDDGSSDDTPSILERWTVEAQPADVTALLRTSM